MPKLLSSPYRDYIFVVLLGLAVIFNAFSEQAKITIAIITVAATLPTIIKGLQGLWERKINIDLFNSLAMIFALSLGEMRSAALIALMLTFASLLDYRTTSRTQDAFSALLKLKPLSAWREENGMVVEVPIDTVKVSDILIVKPGNRVPVDGIVVDGEAKANEAAISGESALLTKKAGDTLLSSTMIEAGHLRFKATHVGADSTIERMVSLMRLAAEQKSQPEKMADRFATIFLPAVALLGAGTYFVTGNLAMVASIFLVACADDMAVAIPLAMTAGLGQAAKRGVLVKGGEWLNQLAQIDTVLLDKTGTLTYGTQKFEKLILADGIVVKDFWTNLAVAEKYSEHPLAKVLVQKAREEIKTIPEPEKFTVHKGSGVEADFNGQNILVGSQSWVESLGFKVTKSGVEQARLHMTVNGKYWGSIVLNDIVRPETKASLDELQALGINIEMLTGDNEVRAKELADSLGITKYRAHQKPEDKLIVIQEAIAAGHKVAMLGDGINDAPALARANVGIAMGEAGTAVAAEAANVIILTDNLARLPEMIVLGRRTRAVINADVWIWASTNLFGFALVFMGFIGPAAAAFYNLGTDFLPMINSLRLFRGRK